MARTHHLLAALGVSGLLLPATAWAQAGHRTMIIDEGDGPNVFHVSMPDIRALREPDFVRNDLPVFDKKLALTESQQPVVERLLEDYLSAFELLAVEFLPKSGPMMMAFGDHAAPGDIQLDHDHTDEAGNGLFIADGAVGDWTFGDGDGPGMVAVQIEASTGGGIGGEDVDIVAGGADGGPTVAIAVKSSGGAELSEEDRKRLEEQAQELVEQLRKQMEEGGGEIVLQGGLPDMASLEERQREFEELAMRAGEFQSEKANLKNKFVLNVQAQLEDDQLERWPALERTLTRHKTLPKGRINGERTDLVRIIESVDSGALSAGASEQVAAYEVVMHEALLRRNAYVEEASEKVDEALQARDTETALDIVDRATALRKAVRDVNGRFAESIAQQLDDAAAADFREKVRRAGYPRVYRKTPGLRSFEAARQIEGLPEETLLAILELEGQYRHELDSQNGEIRRVIDIHQPDQTRTAIARMGEAMDGGEADFAFGHDEDDPIEKAYAKRRDLDRRYVKILEGMLTPEQAAALPKLPKREQFQPFFIRHSADEAK